MATLELFESEWQRLWGAAAMESPVGAVFTRPEIVDLILDLADYRVESGRLAERSVLEPSCGDGAFLTRLVERLVRSEVQYRDGAIRWNDRALAQALRAVDISQAAVLAARGAVVRTLCNAGCPEAQARRLGETWIVQSDFLLHPWRGSFDLVVGNPPYVRIEELPRNLLATYRTRYQTCGDRADLYVAFIECGLGLLSPRGALAFITANRFTKNLYGRRLRQLLAERFHVRHYLNLEHTQPFLSEVSAYPAILVADRQQGRPTLAAALHDVTPETLRSVREPGGLLQEFTAWYPDGGPWLATSAAVHGEMTRLHGELPTLEESAEGTRVGIGVATGADAVFIVDGSLDIEADRLLPLVMVGDIRSDGVADAGRALVNPFDESGGLVPLDSYPRLARYLGTHEAALRKRHIARRSTVGWYRTIDRVWATLQRTPKLLIPDIQRPERTVIGLDEGRFYPHHNVYFVTSAGWDLRALKALLRSSAVREQVRAYSVQLRGGSVRWQAQTLRRLRVPLVTDLSPALLERLSAIADSADQTELDAAADEAFALARRSSVSRLSA